MQRRPGFFDRLRAALRRAFGGGEEEAPPPGPEVPEEYQEETVYYEPEEVQPEYTQEQAETSECIEGYNPGRKEVVIGKGGKNVGVTVFPQFYLENPDLDCLRDLLRRLGSRSYITLILCGTPCNDYPGKEGEEEICLGYARFGRDVVQIAFDASTTDIVDFANKINAMDEYAKLECWESITYIGILDK